MSGTCCPRCFDSGYIETVRGGFWTGEGMSSDLVYCDCPCGDDLRRELAARPSREESSHDR